MFTFTTKGGRGTEPHYATTLSAAADVCSAVDLVVASQARVKVPTGLWIAAVDQSNVPPHMIPALQIRARSGLAYKHGIMLTNGVGTIDADYKDEICVLLYNSSIQSFTIKKGDRIAQICAELVPRLDLPASTQSRQGGFGSTGV